MYLYKRIANLAQAQLVFEKNYATSIIKEKGANNWA